MPFQTLTTVKILHCDKEADFIPSPKRPRSPSLRMDSDEELPYLIASNKVSLDIPIPSSRMPTTIFSKADVGNNTRTELADALILLSITSAIAASNVYPMERMEPISISACGIFSLSLLIVGKDLFENGFC